jgi:ABC-type amino acid transport substrate-binding protein
MALNNIVQKLTTFIQNKLTIPLVSIPAVLLLCSTIKRPGMSPMLITAKTINRMQDSGIPIGVNIDGSPNLMNQMCYVLIDEMVNALKNGEVTAIVTDDEFARNILDKVSGFKILDSSFYSAEYRVAVVSEDAEKQEDILEAVNKLVDNGTAKKIASKYMEY